MIGPFEVGAIAIIGAFLTKMFSIWTEKQGGACQAKIHELEHRIQELEAHQNVEALEERVEILEGIVVSDEFEVKNRLHELNG